jgi:hypothetical protein
MRCRLTCRVSGFFLGGIWGIGKDMGWVIMLIVHFICREKEDYFDLENEVLRC